MADGGWQISPGHYHRRRPSGTTGGCWNRPSQRYATRVPAVVRIHSSSGALRHASLVTVLNKYYCTAVLTVVSPFASPLPPPSGWESGILRGRLVLAFSFAPTLHLFGILERTIVQIRSPCHALAASASLFSAPPLRRQRQDIVDMTMCIVGLPNIRPYQMTLQGKKSPAKLRAAPSGTGRKANSDRCSRFSDYHSALSTSFSFYLPMYHPRFLTQEIPPGDDKHNQS